MAAFLGDTFVKADGSSVGLDYVTRGKIVVVVYTAGRRLATPPRPPRAACASDCLRRAHGILAPTCGDT